VTSGQQRMKKIFPLFVFYILVAQWVMYLYFFLHEAGHAIAVIIFGGKLTGFVVGFWNSHYNFSGDFSNWQNSIRASAGILFPIPIWAVFLWITPRKCTTFFAGIRYIISLGFLASLLPYIVEPILYQNGWRGYNPWGYDDMTAFLNYSGWNGYSVAGIVLMLLTLSIALFQYKAGLRESVLQIRQQIISFKVEIKLLLGMVLVISLAICSTWLIERLISLQ
jgi:hypothetical protein